MLQMYVMFLFPLVKLRSLYTALQQTDPFTIQQFQIRCGDIRI